LGIKEAKYREPPTAAGLEKIEKGTLDYYDIAVWSNLNSGVLEEYLDEKNRVESFQRSKFVWRKVLVGILLGTAFAIITEYVGLKVGIAISGGWYIMYLMGIAMKWEPAEINIAAGANTGATYIGTGFIFTFPAIYLLSSTNQEALLLPGGKTLLSIPPFQELFIVTVFACILTGILGTLFFIIFRRIWLVADPLHTPGWEPNYQLLEISNDMMTKGGDQAMRTLKKVLMWIGITMGFSFLRDFPVVAGEYGEKIPIFDKIFGGRFYTWGNVHVPYDKIRHTDLDFDFIPIQFAIGWFMRLRVAFLINMGSFLTWFVVVPLAVHANIPIYDAQADVFYSLSSFPVGDQAWLAFSRCARYVGVGAILGGGITSLIKMGPTFKSTFQDISKLGKDEEDAALTSDYIEGRGYYEWPMSHIKAMVPLTFIGVFIVFVWGGYPILATLIFTIILVATTFVLAAIAVKVMGETGTQPVSATSFMVLIILLIVFQALKLPQDQLAMMALLGTTAFGGAISMAGDIIWDFKSGLYAGNRPYHLMKGELGGIVPGAIAAILGAMMFSQLLADGVGSFANMAAPQARAFAQVTQALVVGGKNASMIYSFMGIGFLLGIIAELTTGMGTAFGLGMYFPLGLMAPQLVGGGLRDWWEKNRLEPQAKANKWDEKTTTLKRLDTYMIATGLIVGEALAGTILAFYFLVGG